MKPVATQRKARRSVDRTESRLRKAIRPLVRFLDEMQEGIAFFTMEGRVVWCNPSFGKLVGLAAESMHSRHIQDLFLGLSEAEVESLLSADRKGQEWQTVLRTPWNRPAPVVLRTEVVELDGIEGRFLRVQDLEEEKLSAELYSIGKVNRSLFHNASEAIVVSGVNGRVLRSNQAAISLAGSLPLGRMLGEAFPIRVTGSSAARFPDGWEGAHSLLRAMVEWGGFRGVEATLTPPSGGDRQLLISGRYFSEFVYGRASCLILMADITSLRDAEAAQRRSEDRYRRLIEASPDGILVDSGGSLTYVNPAALRFFGAASPDRLLGKGFLELVDPRTRDEISILLNRAIETGEFQRVAETRMTRLDGQETEAELTFLALRGEEPSSVQVIVRDISEQKRAERQIRELNSGLERRVAERTAQLSEAIRDLDGFAYSIAHDFRAPLRAMQGFSRALLDDWGPRLDPPGREYAQRIVDASIRMDGLITDLLAYSRVSRQDLVLDSVPLGGVLEEAISGMKSSIEETRAEIDFEGPFPLVRGHRLTLLQVLTNLLSNAIKFVAPGVRPRVRVRTEPVKGRVRLWVEDNGIGIALEHQARIFRVFERLHRREEYPGTGMGLAIVYRAMERMGGDVGLESAPGQGSRFWIELPLATG